MSLADHAPLAARPVNPDLRRRTTPPFALTEAAGVVAMGLGAVGLFFPEVVKRGLGVRAPAQVVRGVFGLREMLSGYSLAGRPVRRQAVWGKLASDLVDIAALRLLDRPSNARRGTVRVAMGFVLALTALDAVAAFRLATARPTVLKT